MDWGNYYPMFFYVIEYKFRYTFGVKLPMEIAQRLSFVLPIVSLLMVVGLSVLRRRLSGRADHEPTERADQHGRGGDGQQAVYLGLPEDEAHGVGNNIL